MSIISEELQARANEALLEMLSGIEKAADFTVEQAPLVVQELLAWNLAISLISNIIVILIIITFLFTFCKTLSAYGKDKEWAVDNTFREKSLSIVAIFTLIGSGLLGAVFLLVGIVSILDGSGLDWLKIMVAPRVWLLEYAAHLVK